MLAAGQGVGRDDAMSLTIWTNHVFRPEALAVFEQGLRAAGHRLVISPAATASVLAAGAADPTLAEADVAFGQPDVAQVLANTRLKFIELSTAGYTRYDREDFRAAMTARGESSGSIGGKRCPSAPRIRARRRGAPQRLHSRGPK